MDNYCAECRLCCKLIPVINGKMLKDGFQEPLGSLEHLPIEDACKINEEYVNKVQAQFQNVEFYSCKYSSGNKYLTCSQCKSCIEFPSHPMAIVPDECQYLGEIFIKNEAIKHKIRKYKEEITYYQSLIAPGNKENATHEKIIRSIQRFVDKYIPYGAKDW